jgi:acyl-CoA synthetase (NDP forming)
LHPTSKQVQGFPAYPSLSDVKKSRGGLPVDLLTVCIPAQGAGKLVSEALDVQVANCIQVVSGGFGETEHGSKMQQQLHNQLFSMPPSIRPVMNGPNTVGNVFEGGIDTIFIDRTRSNSDWQTGKKNCCLLCQSGAFMLSRVSDIAPAVTPRIAISVGNQLDLSVTDFLEYYVDREEITTFAVYIEGLSEGEGIRLMNIVRHAHELGKAVIIYKAGRTQAGLRAAKGHTASMAGDFGMFKDLLELAGAIVVEYFEEWNQLVMLTTCFPQIMKKKDRPTGVAVVTNAGFEKCASADHLTVNGMEGILKLPEWTEETRKEIDRVFKKHKIDEVVDVSEVLDVTPLFTDVGYYELLRAVLKDPGCDIGLLAGVPETQALHSLEGELDDPKGLLAYVKKLRTEFPDKPLVAVFESGEKYYPLRRELNKMGVVAFSSIDSASKVLGMALRCAYQ